MNYSLQHGAVLAFMSGDALELESGGLLPLVEQNVETDLNATFQPEELTVGGEPRARLVRAYGVTDWFRVDDSYRQASMWTLTGLVWSDADVDAVASELEGLRAAMTTVRRVWAKQDGEKVAYLVTQGGLLPEEEPESSTSVGVTLRFYPREDEWRDADTKEKRPF